MKIHCLFPALYTLQLFGAACADPVELSNSLTEESPLPNPSKQPDLFLRSLATTDTPIELLKYDLEIAVRSAGRGISKRIGEYGIKGQDLLTEIAKIAASESGLFVSAYIGNYNIESEAARIEIAKIAAAQSPLAISVYLGNYGIDNKEALEEILAIANGTGKTPSVGDGSDPGNNPDLFAHFLASYNFLNEKTLIESVKIAASKIGEQVSASIGEYGIREESLLIEIAKIAAAQNGEGLSKYIQNYRITNREALKEIAAIATAQNPEGTSKYLGNYGLDPEASPFVSSEEEWEPVEAVASSEEPTLATEPEVLPLQQPEIPPAPSPEPSVPATRSSYPGALIEAGAGYFFFTDSTMNAVYNQGGLELRLSGSYPIRRVLHLYGAVEYIQKSGHSLYEAEETTYRQVPLSLGVKIVPWNNTFFAWYVSIGPRYFFAQTSHESPYVPKRMYGNGLGGFGNTGLLFTVAKHLTFDLFGEYSYAKITFRAHGVQGERAQIGGMTFGGSLGYSF